VVDTIGRAEVDAAVDNGSSGFALDVEGRREPPLSIVCEIGGSTGGPSPVPVPRSLPTADTGGSGAGTSIGAGAGVGTGTTIEAGSVRLMRSPDISSSRTASHVQRISRAHSSTSGKRMRKWSSWTTSISARTVVAKKARVSVDPVGDGPAATAVGGEGVKDGGGVGETGRVEEEEGEGGGG